MNGRVQVKEQLPGHEGIAFAGALHTTPHFPQFDVSDAVSTQEPPQFVSEPQLTVHVPALQTSPVPHTFEQLPQC